MSLASNRRRVLRVLAVAAVAAVSLTACSSDEPAGHAREKASQVNYALPPNATPNWILPIGIPGKLATHNGSINDAMWPPLVSYQGSHGDMAWDKQMSMAKSVDWSDGGKTVTLKLKDMHWSDGEPVTSRDVEFWFNLVRAAGDDWASYTEGRMPSNVTSVDTPDDKTVVLSLDDAYNHKWFMSTQLVFVTPLPRHAWGKTSDDGDIVDDTDPKNARAIFDYLVDEAKDLQSYATNPLWKVVDGPMTVKRYDTTGHVTLVKNDEYDGEDPAQSDVVKLMPFTSADAEVNAVRSQSVDYGYIPASALVQKEQYEELGYTISPWSGWSVTYMPYNFNNPKMGAVYKQLYVRQALQHTIDQEGISDAIWHGGAEPGFGPVPQNPDSEYLSETQKENPYPYDLKKAKRIFADHGWTRGGDGVLECTSPGTGDHDCGEGIDEGTRMSITMLVQSGSQEVDNQFAAIQSSMDQVGVKAYLKKTPLNQVLAQTVPCTPDQDECSWQTSYFGAAGSWYYPAYPADDRLFGTGGSVNFGNYSNKKADQLVRDAVLSNDPDSMKEFSALLAKDLPVMWLPNPVYQTSVITDGLTGTTQDPGGNFFPQRWGWED